MDTPLNPMAIALDALAKSGSANADAIRVLSRAANEATSANLFLFTLLVRYLGNAGAINIAEFRDLLVSLTPGPDAPDSLQGLARHLQLVSRQLAEPPGAGAAPTPADLRSLLRVIQGGLQDQPPEA